MADSDKNDADDQRRQKPHDRSEQEELLELYKAAVGMA